jgi:6,7-dimethyl-8-ribityllumazine synthase
MKKMSTPKICIITSMTHPEITSEMELRAIKEIKKYKGSKIYRRHVKGAFEIPYAISESINKKKFNSFIAIGCIIKGETPNFDFISSAITNGIINLSMSYKKPIGNSVLTCLDKKQAYNRLNKGREAVVAVCDILSNGVFDAK